MEGFAPFGLSLQKRSRGRDEEEKEEERDGQCLEDREKEEGQILKELGEIYARPLFSILSRIEIMEDPLKERESGNDGR